MIFWIDNIDDDSDDICVDHNFDNGGEMENSYYTLAIIDIRLER